MIKTHSLDVMSYFLTSEEVTLNSLMKAFTMSEQEVNDELDHINSLLGDTVIVRKRNHLYLTEEGVNATYQYVLKKNQKLYSFYSPKIRKTLILIKLLIGEGYNPLQEMADYVYVSKNTALADIKELKSDISENVEIKYSRSCGYNIHGNEFDVRHTLADSIHTLLKIPAGKFILFEKGIMEKNEIFHLRKRLEKIEIELGIFFSDEVLDALPYLLMGTILRSKFSNQNLDFSDITHDIKGTKEYPRIKSIFWSYSFLSEMDLKYLTLQVLSSSIIDFKEEVIHYNEMNIEELVCGLIKSIEENMAINFPKFLDLKKRLLMHIKPAIYRLKLGLHVYNPLTGQFMEKHHSIYLVVKKALRLFEDELRIEFTDDEIALIAMIFLGEIYQTYEDKLQPVFTAVVLCRSGTSISKLLLGTLKEEFPKIKFIDVYSLRKFEAQPPDVDFIFTTIPIHTDIVNFLVPSLLDELSRFRLRKQVEEAIESDASKQAKEIMAYLAEIIPKDKMALISGKVEGFFEDKKLPIPLQEKDADLLKDSSQITIVNENIPWNEIIDLAFYEMGNRQTITHEYVEECKKIFYESYETMMIGPNVFLPHAAPDRGVIEADAQILILKNTIHAPNGSEVDIVVALAPCRNNEHVPWLLKLNDTFLNNEQKNRIMKSNDMEEVLDIFKERVR